jgi:hypothetical protein
VNRPRYYSVKGDTLSNPICSAPQCDKPAHDGFVCSSCVATLRRDLNAVPDLLADLDITISKQDRLSDSEKCASSERPLPLRLEPMEAKRDLGQTLATWTQHVVTRLGVLPPCDIPVVAPHVNRRGALIEQRTDRQVVALAAWMVGHLGDVLIDPEAGSLADEIGYAVITAQRAVDKPLQLVYAGPCDECTTDLYAHPRKAEVACRGCDAVYDIASRREWLLEQAEGQLLTATEMSRALPGLLQQPLTASMIRNYASRGRLTRHPALPGRPNEPVYRVGEVLDLLASIRRENGRSKAS